MIYLETIDKHQLENTYLLENIHSSSEGRITLHRIWKIEYMQSFNFNGISSDQHAKNDMWTQEFVSSRNFLVTQIQFPLAMSKLFALRAFIDYFWWNFGKLICTQFITGSGKILKAGTSHLYIWQVFSILDTVTCSHGYKPRMLCVDWDFEGKSSLYWIQKSKFFFLYLWIPPNNRILLLVSLQMFEFENRLHKSTIFLFECSFDSNWRESFLSVVCNPITSLWFT